MKSIRWSLALVGAAVIWGFFSRGPLPSYPALSSATQDTIAIPAPLPRESPHASNPLERAVARGGVLEMRLGRTPDGGLVRERLLRSDIRPGLLRVLDEWRWDGASQAWQLRKQEMYRSDQLLIRASAGISVEQLATDIAPLGIQVRTSIGDGIFVAGLSESGLDAMPAALSALAAHQDLAVSAEADGVGFALGAPDDPHFASQWGFHNTGQSGGVADVDVDAVELWDIGGGATGVVIAVADTGMDYNHPDLQNVAWTNPDEVPGDGLDNDSNGKVDDIKGWDFHNADADPQDDNSHGTMVTGIITAIRNNGVGTAGLANGSRIMACKIINAAGGGDTSNLLAAMRYAREEGAQVMNFSVGGYPPSALTSEEITTCGNAGILLCMASGNDGTNNDVSPLYPASYPQDNIIAVGNHTRSDGRRSSSNYGPASVDLFAPGTEIISTSLDGTYETRNATSYSAPFVTAAAAVIKCANPGWAATEIKNAIMTAAVPRPAYNGLCVTGGRLNLLDAIGYAYGQEETDDSDGDGFSNLFEYMAGTRVDLNSSKPGVFMEAAPDYLKIGSPGAARTYGNLIIERSGDLESWTTVGVTDFSSAGLRIGGIPFAGEETAGFLRIRAEP